MNQEDCFEVLRELSDLPLSVFYIAGDELRLGAADESGYWCEVAVCSLPRQVPE